jgi:hypothetical protein
MAEWDGQWPNAARPARMSAPSFRMTTDPFGPFIDPNSLRARVIRLPCDHVPQMIPSGRANALAPHFRRRQPSADATALHRPVTESPYRMRARPPIGGSTT